MGPDVIRDRPEVLPDDLIDPDWEAAMERQGDLLSRLLPQGCRVLDVAAGIGTQSLPLAAKGYEVVARDLSEVIADYFFPLTP